MAATKPAQNFLGGKIFDFGRATVFFFRTPLLKAQNN